MAVFLGVLMVACRRRLGRSRRAAIGLLAGAILLASPRRSEAQTATFSLERLQIAGSPDDGMAIFRPAFGPTQLFSQLALVYTRNALRADTFVHDAARAEALRGPAVALQLTTHITAGAAIDGRGAIQVSVPMIIAQRGYSTKNGSAGLDREVLLAPSALGDMRIDGRVLLGRNEAKTLSFAARGAIFLPTGDETSFAGDRGVGGNAGLAAELDAGMLFVTLNLGASLRPKSSFVDLTVGSELVYGLSAYVPLEQGRVRLGAELFGSAGILPETLGVMESAPLEWSLNGRFALGDKAPVFMGLGAGSRITAGYAPDIRLVARVGGAFSVETEESPPPRLLVPSTAADDDADGDGVPDLQDVCPGEKEDHKRLEDGCAEHDRDEDGLVDAMDKCPAEAESKNGINDADGCPEIDTDGDGLPDEVDPCPKEPGEQGCPPPQPVIRLQIEFASKQATIDPTSYPVLDELAGRLVASPEIKLVRIEGHTDDRGDARSNERLSKERASAVRKYLVERGRVDPARLVSEGLGSSRPITSNDTPEGRARNRRVELHIVK
jgi:outer membrane protein OmpA-like peptidoglycan-associated protein